MIPRYSKDASDVIEAYTASMFATLAELMEYERPEDITWVENADGSVTPLLDPTE